MRRSQPNRHNSILAAGLCIAGLASFASSGVPGQGAGGCGGRAGEDTGLAAVDREAPELGTTNQAANPWTILVAASGNDTEATAQAMLPAATSQYEITGDTTPFANDYSSSGGGFGAAGRDAVFSIQTVSTKSIKASTFATGWDTVLYVRDNNGNQVTLSDDVGSNLYSEVSFVATAGVRYYVYLDGKNAASFGPYTLQVNVFTLLAAPTNLTIIPTLTQFFVSWDAVPNATAYNIYAKFLGGADPLPDGPTQYFVPTNRTVFNDLAASNYWGFDVRAFNTTTQASTMLDLGSFSPRIPAMLASRELASFTATPQNGQVYLSWQAPVPPPSEYIVLRDGVISAVTNQPFVTMAGVNGQDYSFIATATGASTVPLTAMPAIGANRALSRPTSCSVNPSSPCANAVDQDSLSTTAWSPTPGANAVNSVVQVDLGAQYATTAKSINQIVVKTACPKVSGALRSASIQTSATGLPGTWTTRKNIAACAAYNTTYTTTHTANILGAARFIRVQADVSTGAYAVYDIKAFGN